MTSLSRSLRISLFIVVLLAHATGARAQTPADTPAPAGTIPAAAVEAAGDPRAAQVEALLEAMSPADRVGQLFVITFDGSDTSFESDIAELIYAYRVGGVVLSPAHRNFSNEPGTDTPLRVATLANQLQAIAYGILLPPEAALQPVPNEPWPPANLVALERETNVAPPNIPLLIGVEQLGNNLPKTALRRGFTPLPSQLAVGATWNPQLAEEIGALVGRELRAVGANLLLGPNLDVIDQPLAAQVGGMGVFSFGGNPDWVSRMARAYVTGVHTGSGGRLATFVRHFPGQGNIDRMPEEEVATIQKSVDELRAVALPPFLAVTAPAANSADGASGASGDSPADATDGMIISNMQFSALQGADSQGMPLSLDPDLPRIVADAGLAEWRAAGGLLMSGPLGVSAVRKYYDPLEADFPARRLALDAFTSGHDLLFLDQYSSDGSYQSQLDNMRATIAFFQERYRSDADFAAQVDAAVRRILRLKLRLYGTDVDALPIPEGPPLIPLSRVLVAEEDLAALPGNDTPPDPAPAQVAREAITVLSPDLAAGENLPPAPQLGDQLLIITDSRLQQECADCPAEAAVDPDAIARIILQLYGPEATGQIQPEQLTSITFADLLEALDSPRVAAGAPAATPTPAVANGTPPAAIPPDAALEEGAPTTPGAVPEKTERIETAIARADWLIFAMLDVSPLYPSSAALSRFLSERGDNVRDKQVVVLALNAPYFLDGTEISKLSSYYGVYSKTQVFLESGVRAIFRGFSPTGAPPVSVPGTPYRDLNERLSPAPGQVLPLRVWLGDEMIAANGAPAEGERSAPSVVNVGDAIRIEVGPIFDANGHIVPNGTTVSFDVRFEGAELALPVNPAGTRDGVAAVQVALERGGVLRVAAQAGAATSGDPVMLNVIEVQPEPTAAPTQVVTGAVPMTGGVAAGEPVTVTAQSEQPTGTATAPGRRVNGITLLLSLFTIVLTTALFLLLQTRVFSRERFFKGALWATIAGLLAYIIYGAGVLPGGDLLAEHLSIFGAPAIVFAATLAPLLWLQIRSGSRT